MKASELELPSNSQEMQSDLDTATPKFNGKFLGCAKPRHIIFRIELNAEDKEELTKLLERKGIQAGTANQEDAVGVEDASGCDY